MDKKTLFLSLFLSLMVWFVLISCHKSQRVQETRESISPEFIYPSITTRESCDGKDGYWYNDRCWKNFSQESYNPDEVAEYVNAELKKIRAVEIRESGNTYSLIKTYAHKQSDGAILSMVYGKPSRPDAQKTMVFFLDNTAFEASDPDPVIVILLHGNFYAYETEAERNENLIAQGTIPLNVIDRDNYSFSLSGELQGVDGVVKLETTALEVLTLTGMGNMDISISGTEAILEGELGVLSYDILRKLRDDHPEVTTLVLKDVPGSVNQAVNLHTGYLVRSAGYNTKLYSESQIASGGVELFLAGVERMVESGAEIDIHSWCCVDGLSAQKLPREHPAHHDYLKYYRTLYGEEQGSDMYFYIIHAADYDSLYRMTKADIEKWGFATSYLD